jgi:uncharacterized RDD family membrane protein YckC
MTSAERLCLVAARSEGLLADFVLLFLIRWGLKHLGVEYVHFQPVLDDVSPPLAFSDFAYPASALFYGSMYFVSGLPELILAGMWCVYAIVALSVFGRTFGMRQAGLTLVDLQGHRPGLARIIVRQLVAPISAICWLGYLPAAFSANAVTLHDMASGTKMVLSGRRERKMPET